jgi:hypothetical protein
VGAFDEAFSDTSGRATLLEGHAPAGDVFAGAEKDVAHATSELATPGVVMSRRGLDVREGGTSEGKDGEGEECKSVFHAT